MLLRFARHARYEILAFTVLCGVALYIGGCASAPAKQRAVVTVQSVAAALNTLQDFELTAEVNGTIPALNRAASPAVRALCPAGIPIAVPTANHNVVQCLFAVMYQALKQAATDLQTWVPGAATPLSLLQLKGFADSALGLVQSLAPAGTAQTILTDTQAVVDALLQVATQMGVTL